MTFSPYGRQWVDETDIASVVEVLRGDWLTTGPAVARFEEALLAATGGGHAAAVSSGTAALHAAYYALGLKPGDEVIVPALTFSATANAARYLGATVVFADIDPKTLTVSPNSVRALVSERTRIITAVDYAGHPADYDALRAIAEEHGLALVSDACHALGATYRGTPLGGIADATCFSFHPVKCVTTGEGGAVVTNDPDVDARVRRFRSHGIQRGVQEVSGVSVGAWGYDIDSLGYNYRISDFQCALGTAQLRKLGAWVLRRQAISALYRELLADLDDVVLPPDAEWCSHAYHLFPVRVPPERRAEIFSRMRSAAIGVQVHYIPVNALTVYRTAGHSPHDTPATWETYRGLLSLPMFPKMTNEDVERAVAELRRSLR